MSRIQDKVINRFVRPIADYEAGGEHYGTIIPVDTQAYAIYTNSEPTHRSGIYYVLGDGIHTYIELREGFGSKESGREYLAVTDEIYEVIGQGIEEERQARIAADEQLQANIDAEEAARIQGDIDLSNALEEETERAEAAEQSLRNALDAEIIERGNADVQLNTKIEAETARAQGAESGLSTRIEEEASIRETMDNDLHDQIIAEKTRAQTAEAGLGTRIDNINATLDTYGDIVTHNVNEFATAAQGTKADTALQPSDVINNVTSTSTNKPLSANMGKELNDRLDNIEARGKYLSTWDCTTGLPETNPTTSTYVYHTGDYYVVGKVAETDGANYRPDGTEYVVGQRSTVLETSEVKVNDTYLFDGSVWKLLTAKQKDITFSSITGSPYDNTELASALNEKQDNIDDLETIRSNAAAGKEAKDTIDTYGDIVTHNADEFMSSTVKYGADVEYTKDNYTLALKDQDGNTLGTTIIKSGEGRAYAALSKVKPYLYNITYADIDYKFATEYFNSRKPIPNMGACSSIRRGKYAMRNFDWFLNEDAEFVIHTARTAGHYASVAVACSVPGMTEAYMQSGEYDEEMFKILPFFILDGVNEYGLNVSSMVVPLEKGLTTGTTPVIEKREEVCTLALIRYILDKFQSAEEALEYLNNYVSLFTPTAMAQMGYELHFLISDRNKSYSLEIINNVLTYTDVSDKPIMTNFYLDGVTFAPEQVGGTPAGGVYTPATVSRGYKASDLGITPKGDGLERYNLIVFNYDNLTSVSAIQDFMMNTDYNVQSLRYTRSYRADTVPAWNTEFVGDWDWTDESGHHEWHLTVDSPEADFEEVKAHVRPYYERHLRDGIVWQTTHSSVYDLEENKLYLTVQEDGERLEFGLDYYTREEIDTIFQTKLTSANAGNNITITGSGKDVVIAADDQPVHWGEILGTLADQTDLQTALDNKQDKLTAGREIEIVTSTEPIKNFIDPVYGDGTLPLTIVDGKGYPTDSPYGYMGGAMPETMHLTYFYKIHTPSGYNSKETVDAAIVTGRTGEEPTSGAFVNAYEGGWLYTQEDGWVKVIEVLDTDTDYYIEFNRAGRNAWKMYVSKDPDNMGEAYDFYFDENSGQFPHVFANSRFNGAGIKSTNDPATSGYIYLDESYYIDLDGTRKYLVVEASGNVINFTGNYTTQTQAQGIADQAIGIHNVSSDAHGNLFNEKQDNLISGQNIKTINNISLLGSGNIDVSAGATAWGTIVGDLADQEDLQQALDNKLPTSTKYGTGIDYTSANSTLTLKDQDGNTLDTTTIQIPDSATWGNITGTLSNQTDLNQALSNKYDTTNPSGYQNASQVSTAITNSIVNNTTSTATNKSLSAAQGKALQDQIDALKQRGKYLSIWNCTTGKPTTEPSTPLPYVYETGSYFIVGYVGTTNYKPTGTQYTGAASTVRETNTVAVNDVYYFDGSAWALLHTAQPTVAFSTISGDPHDNTALGTELDNKVEYALKVIDYRD